MKPNAMTFDLFGTLAHLDERRLPRLEIDGVSTPSLLAAPFRRLRERVPAADLARLLVAYFEARTDLAASGQHEPDRELAPDAHVAKWLERAGIADRDLVRDLARDQLDATLRAARPAEHASRVLEALRTRGCRLGLVSNVSDPDGGRAILSNLGLDHYFDVVVFSGDVGWRKPDRRLFERAIALMDAAPEQIAHVGDELRADVWGAGRCGMATVWINATGAPFDGEYPPALTIPAIDSMMDAEL